MYKQGWNKVGEGDSEQGSILEILASVGEGAGKKLRV